MMCQPSFPYLVFYFIFSFPFLSCTHLCVISFLASQNAGGETTCSCGVSSDNKTEFFKNHIKWYYVFLSPFSQAPSCTCAPEEWKIPVIFLPTTISHPLLSSLLSIPAEFFRSIPQPPIFSGACKSRSCDAKTQPKLGADAGVRWPSPYEQRTWNLLQFITNSGILVEHVISVLEYMKSNDINRNFTVLIRRRQWVVLVNRRTQTATNGFSRLGVKPPNYRKIPFLHVKQYAVKNPIGSGLCVLPQAPLESVAAYAASSGSLSGSWHWRFLRSLSSSLNCSLQTAKRKGTRVLYRVPCTTALTVQEIQQTNLFFLNYRSIPRCIISTHNWGQ